MTGFVLAEQARVQVTLCPKLGGRATPAGAHFRLFMQSRISGHGMRPPAVSLGLPVLINLNLKTPTQAFLFGDSKSR